MVMDYQIKGDMSEFGSFWVKTAENDCKNCTVLCGSLKGDLWPKLTPGGIWKLILGSRDGFWGSRDGFWGSREGF